MTSEFGPEPELLLLVVSFRKRGRKLSEVDVDVLASSLVGRDIFAWRLRLGFWK